MAGRCHFRSRAVLPLLPLLLWLGAPRADQVFQSPSDFLAQAFPGRVPAPRLLWITRDLRPQIRAILGHDLGALRVRYWERGGRSAWILDEIGKERPITTGVILDQGHIEQLQVLVFRESRGSEVRYPFFTDQFRGAHLDGDEGLDRPIDGISGATLSVGAVTRLARLALYLSGQIPHVLAAKG
jgi:FMN-binding domain